MAPVAHGGDADRRWPCGRLAPLCGATASARGFDATNVIEVSVTRAHRWRHRDGTVAHHVDALDAPDIVVVDGIRCTGLARTLVDVGTVCADPMIVRRALTDVRRRGASLRWVQSTAERLHRPGQRGSGLLLLELASIPYEGRVPDSWFEELLARRLDDSDFGTVVAQCPIRGANGRVIARTDIGLPDVKLGLEGHSRRFHFGPDAEPLDEQRDLQRILRRGPPARLATCAGRPPRECVLGVFTTVPYVGE